MSHPVQNPAAVLVNPPPAGSDVDGVSRSRPRVMFICSSLAMGRDGVGDYVRLLAGACSALGCDGALLALQDSHVHEPLQLSESEKPPMLRLPASMPWSERIARAIEFRESFRPDWVSLQFVPYGFNAKGIVWGVEGKFAEVIGGTPLHLMFHELWIGLCRSASWKERLVGALQRLSILRMTQRLAPLYISTSNATYIRMLGDRKVAAKMLPLFGNIAFAGEGEPKSAGLPSTITSLYPALRGEARSDWWLVVFFGTLHPEWEAEPLFSIIRRAAGAAGRQVCFLAVGRLGMAGDRKWSSMTSLYGGSFTFVKMGEQLAERISHLLQAADFGIAASPWQLIGKSGSAMAMLEHGLPVIANRDNWRARGFEPQVDPIHALLHRCDDQLEAKLSSGLKKQAPRNGVAETAAEFVRALNAGRSPRS